MQRIYREHDLLATVSEILLNLAQPALEYHRPIQRDRITATWITTQEIT